MNRTSALMTAGALILAASAGLTLLTACETGTRDLPANIGDLRLREEIRGTAAAAIIDRMHGKGVTPRETRIGAYEGPGGDATLYVSRYRSDAEAREVFEKMDAGIAAGHPHFVHHRLIEVVGTRVSFCLGAGQAHYYLRAHQSVWWLAVDQPVATATAEALIRRLAAR